MRKDEWDDFYLDIATHDIKVPIEVTGDGTIVDGRHRWKAAHGLNYELVPIIDAPLNGEDPGEYMIKAAVLRRHLTDDQRATIAVLWANENKIEPVPPPPGPGRGHTESNKAVAERNATALTESLEQPTTTIVESSEPKKKEDKHKTRTEACATFKTKRGKFDKAKKVLKNNPKLFEKVRNGDIALNNADRPWNISAKIPKSEKWRSCRNLSKLILR
jgi:hypothetical protein